MKRPLLVKALLVLTLVALLLASTPAYALQKTGKNYTVVDKRDYPIIFIPGMAGSVLDVGGGANAWPGSLALNDDAFTVLALKDDGRSPLQGVRPVATDTVRYGLGDVTYGIGDVLSPGTKNIIAKVTGFLVGAGSSGIVGPTVGSALGAVAGSAITGDWQYFPVYQGFYEYMELEGYKYNDNPTGKVFFDFPYDFRQDNNRWTTLLDKKVDAVLKETGSDKVILVGHSMGGLQARLYMKSASRAKKVAAVVFMGTPHHGSVMPFWAMTEGYNFGNSKLSDTRMWEISGNWEAGYQLLPDFPFILDEAKEADDPAHLNRLKNPNPNTEWAITGLLDVSQINTENWVSSQEADRVLKQLQSEIMFGNEKPLNINYGLPNSRFAVNSIDFHKELGDSVDKYPWVKYYGIRGTGQSTAQAFAATFENVTGIPKPVLRLTKIYSNLGDGTVPLEGGRVKGLEPGGEYEVVSEHGAIPSNADAQKILTNLRKQINNEEFREELVEKVGDFAEDNLDKLQPSAVRDTAVTMLDVVRELTLLFMRGTPDLEKRKLLNELKDMAAQVFRNARINITIASGVEKDEKGKERPEHVYINIVDYEIEAVGTGVASGATLNIQVDSLATLEQAMASTSSLGAAYQSGKITVGGTGLVNKLNAKLAKWISKYARFRF